MKHLFLFEVPYRFAAKEARDKHFVEANLDHPIENYR
jgi:hypothetical protein